MNNFRNVLPRLKPTALSALLALYPIGDFAANPSANLSAGFYPSAYMFRDILLVCPKFNLDVPWPTNALPTPLIPNTNYQSAYTEDASYPPVYLYIQNHTLYTPHLEASGDPRFSVIQTSEFPDFFGSFEFYNTNDSTLYPTKSNYELNAQQSRAWSTFANVGQPSLRNTNTLRGWERASVAENDTTAVSGAKL
jgi:hypothetical protein